MSNLQPAQVIALVKEQEEKFLSLNDANGKVLDFEQECLFARQQLLKNNFTLKIAGQNPSSLKGAVLNVAAIGLSLNPASQHAYLVPRDGAICLDISFQGLKKLATDSGSIKWAKCELVYENDVFEWNGPASAPTHKADPFSDRGNIKGGYCIAKLPDGETLTEVMPVDEINKIRDRSKAFTSEKGPKGPWVDWYEEMAKKTILKRAYKQWPQTANRRRLDAAVEVLHDTEGTAYTIEQHTEFMSILQNNDALRMYLFLAKTDETVTTALYNSFAKGEKTANKQRVTDLQKQGFETMQQIVADFELALESNDETGIREVIDSFNPDDFELVKSQMTTNHLAMLGDFEKGEAA